MKRILLFTVAGLLLFGCARRQEKAVISGTINAQVQEPPEKYFVGLYPLNLQNRRYIGEPIEFIETTVPEFEIQAEPGKYILVVYSLETETMKDYMLLTDDADRISYDIELPPRGVDEEIGKVGVIGEFCRWDARDARMMTKEDGKWMLNPSGILKPGDRYNFAVNDIMVFDIVQKQIEPVRERAGLNNIYSGGPLILDPGLYQQPRLQPVIAVNGYDMHDAFISMIIDLETIDVLKMQLLQENPRLNLGEYEQNYRTLMDSLGSIQALYHPLLHQAFIEKRLELIMAHHPVGFEFSIVYRSSEPDSMLMKQIYYGRRFRDFFTSILNQLRQMDPVSPLLTGRWAGSVLHYGHFPSRDAILQKRFELYDNFFFDYLVDFVERSPSRSLCAELLYNAGYFYAKEHEPEKARSLIRILKKSYPDPVYVESGLADRVLRGMEMSPGKRAPDFTVNTLSGEVLTLSDLRGKFVFLDFWG